MQRPRPSLPGCHFVGRGARRERAHPAAAAGAVAAAHECRVEGAGRTTGMWVAAAARRRRSSARRLLHHRRAARDAADRRRVGRLLLLCVEEDRTGEEAPAPQQT